MMAMLLRHSAVLLKLMVLNYSSCLSLRRLFHCMQMYLRPQFIGLGSFNVANNVGCIMPYFVSANHRLGSPILNPAMSRAPVALKW